VLGWTTKNIVATTQRATIDDLYRVTSKAELVNGQLKIMEPTGGEPGRASFAIAASLRDYERHTGAGRSYGDNVGFRVYLPNRESFSPDASFHAERSVSMKFVEGAPLFAAEVRSEGDYGPASEREMARKRADYFAAGTLVVWDVDLLSEDVVRVYLATDPDRPTIFHRGELAEAEPAVPGWRFPVDELFE